MDRRTAIAEAAITVIDRDGLRGLTHRKLDRELDLPEGTTSNYARTRRDLVELVVRRMAARSMADLAPLRPPPTTAAAAAARLAETFELTAARGADHRTRFALTIEVTGDPALHTLLTVGSPVRAPLLKATGDLLAALDVPDPPRRAVDLIGVIDGLLFDRVVGNSLRGSPVDVRAVLTAWLVGAGANR